MKLFIQLTVHQWGIRASQSAPIYMQNVVIYHVGVQVIILDRVYEVCLFIFYLDFSTLEFHAIILTIILVCNYVI